MFSSVLGFEGLRDIKTPEAIIAKAMNDKVLFIMFLFFIPNIRYRTTKCTIYCEYLVFFGKSKII
jgi:hypothetical protein